MKMKEEIYQRFVQYEWNDVSDSLKQSVLNAMEEYAKQFNPMRIDEERFMKIYQRKDIYRLHQAFEEYNSTIPARKELEPLPSEMPEEFKMFIEINFGESINPIFIWNWMIENYGTPKREELPNVEDLKNELIEVYNKSTSNTIFNIAQHIINKYSLPSQKEKLPVKEEVIKRLCAVSVNLDELDIMEINSIMNLLESQPSEWWMDLKEGDKFMYNGQVKTFYGYELEHKLFCTNQKVLFCSAKDCTPYVEPVMTAQDVIKAHNLSEQEVKAIREGGR